MSKPNLYDGAEVYGRSDNMKKTLLLFTLFFLCFSLFAASYNKMLKEWNSLSEDEKWLCLLTEPFLSRFDMSTTTVNPEPKNKGKKSRNFLENDWKLHSKNDVLNLVARYKNGTWGDNRHFIKAGLLLDKYPDISIEEIAKIECLDARNVVDLYFYTETKNIVGYYDVYALDAVRILSVLRWSVAVGWLTKAEAVNQAQPFIDALLVIYDSWEDFTAHFAVSWSYYLVRYGYDFSAYQKGLTAERTKYMETSGANSKSKQVINHNIKFPAGNLEGSRILTYDDMFYTPGEEASKWYLIERWNCQDEKDLSASEKEKIAVIRKEKADIPAMAYCEILDCFYGSSDVKNIPEYIKVMEGAGSKKDIYHLAYIWYGVSFLDDNNDDIEQLRFLMESQQNEKHAYYLAAFYNILKLSQLQKKEKNFENIDMILSETENYSNLAIESIMYAKNDFPLTGDIEILVSAFDTVMKFNLFDIYSSSAYVFYEARDLENAQFYLEKSDESLEVLKNCTSGFLTVDMLKPDIEVHEKKLKEVRAFISDRYNKDIENNNKKVKDPKINAA